MTDVTASEGSIERDHQLQIANLQKQIQQLSERPGPAQPREPLVDDEVIDLREYWRVLKRRKGTILTMLAIALIAAIVMTSQVTPIYRATLLLQIEREPTKVLEYEDLSPEEEPTTKDFYTTQYELLQSNSLARRVIDQLGLEASPTYAEKDDQSLVSGLIASIKGLLGGADSTSAEDDVEPDLETLFLENLSVEPVRNSRLVNIHYDSPNPEEAAAVVNAVAQSFISLNMERRFEASSYAKTFLEEQIQQTRANLEDSEQQLVDYAREREIIDLDDKLQILRHNLSEMSSELTKAEAERIATEAGYRQMLQHGERHTADILESPVIQSLKERVTDLQAQYQESLKIYTPEYPRMQELQQQIAELQRQIRQESAAIATSVKARFNAHVDKEAKLRQRIDEIKDEILALQDRSTDFQSLKREVDTYRELYDGLLQRMKQVGVAAGVTANNVSVVDAAKIPRKPYKPNLKTNLAIALALGLFLGVLLAFLFETLDDTMKSMEEVEKRTGYPILGAIPMISSKRLASSNIGLIPFNEPRSPLAEAYRSLRTALTFSSANGAPQSLHFTSTVMGEGKSTSAASTAIAFAQAGSKVLLIDGDLRSPSLHHIFALPNTSGLTNYLASDVQPAEIALPSSVNNLFVIPSGPLPPNPVELLSSAKMFSLMHLGCERFDHVILDGPPIIGLADALVLANLARVTVLVVEANKTRVGSLEGAMKRLRGAKVNVLGTLLTKLRHTSAGYGYGYDYYYNYDYGEVSNAPALARQAKS